MKFCHSLISSFIVIEVAFYSNSLRSLILWQWKTAWVALKLGRGWIILVGGVHVDVMVKVLNCSLEVSEFKLQMRYYVHLWTNTLGKGMNPLISQTWVKLYQYCFFYKNEFGLSLFGYPFEMRLLNLRIFFFYLLQTFCPHLGSFFVVSSLPEVVKIGWNVVKKKQQKNYQDEDKKSAIKKKKNF